MDVFWQALSELIVNALQAEHWPWFATAVIFTVIGQFTTQKLFTRKRAYATWEKRWVRVFWKWGRDTLMLHPLFAGATLGFVFRDPEGKGWLLQYDIIYFATAGVASLFAWGYLQYRTTMKKGFRFRLPGISDRPVQPDNEQGD